MRECRGTKRKHSDNIVGVLDKYKMVCDMENETKNEIIDSRVENKKSRMRREEALHYTRNNNDGENRKGREKSSMKAKMDNVE